MKYLLLLREDRLIFFSAIVTEGGVWLLDTQKPIKKGKERKFCLILVVGNGVCRGMDLHPNADSPPLKISGQELGEGVGGGGDMQKQHSHL